MKPYLYIIFIFLCVAILELLDVRQAVSNAVIAHRAKMVNLEVDNSFDKATFKFRKYLKKESDLLAFTKTPFTIFLILMGVSIAGGFMFGEYMFHDSLLSLALTLCFVTFPFLYLDKEAANIKVIEEHQLENSMSIVTNSYLSCHDVVSAIRESIPLLEYPKPFEGFLREITYFDSNVDNALQHMTNKCPNKFFIQWVDILILAQSDKNMMDILPTIVEQMNEHRRMQIEANTSMATIWMEYFGVLAIVCLFPIAFKVISTDAYAILIGTKWGKVLMLALIASIMYSLKRAVSINKPLDV